jgi:heptosyltransferase I
MAVPPLSTLTPQRIALLKPSALGDIMHALPVLTALRRRFPAAHLAWIVNRSYEPVLRNHPDLNEIIPFDRGAMGRGWVQGAATHFHFLRQLRAGRFDLVIDLQCLFRSGLIARATGARWRVGLASAREGAARFYTHPVEDKDVFLHAVDRYWRVAEALGAGEGPKTFRLAVDPEARAWARQLLRSAPRPWLAVGVGARWLTKRWPPAHFAALVDRAQRHTGGTALFVGSPDEAALAQEAAAALTGPVHQLAGTTTLPQLVALLSEADVMLANDTGPLHLAVALGRPVVAPYTCTLVGDTGPYGQEARAVQTEVWCRGSYHKRCPRMDCMAELTPDRLWPALHAALQLCQRQRRPA